MAMKDLTDAVVVVTGAASGIGQALAHEFSAAGATLVMADVETAALEAAAATLPATALAVPTDVSSKEQVDALARATVDRYGRVDVVCNNAGVCTFNLLEDQTLNDWHWIFDVNVMGIVHGLASFLPIMRAQGTPGHVVNTASSAGLVGAVPFMGPYAASKAAAVVLSETLRDELALAGSPIGVTVLCPGFVNTNVLESERNRPTATANTPRSEQSEQVRQFVKDSFASPEAREPSEVAAMVLDAVRHDRFWVVTQPALDQTAGARLDGIRAGIVD
jgi:NAD(P)-dependent dehydrogenase (short-subunit alcohol dehydrogenase family)